MAVQLHIAYSGTFSGVGSFAGGPYWCAEGSEGTARSQCMSSPGQIDVNRYVEKVKSEAKAGRIDPLANLKGSRVYIFSGTNDYIVGHPEGAKLGTRAHAGRATLSPPAAGLRGRGRRCHGRGTAAGPSAPGRPGRDTRR